MTTGKPLYQHDCKACQYLGDYSGSDLYYCPGLMGGSLVARDSNDHSSYTSTKFDLLVDNGEFPMVVVEAARRQIGRWTSGT